MNLRPHHILCIQKFTGHGYSEEFTLHMTELTAELKKDPERSVDIVQGCDELCRVCPHNSGGVCGSLEKVDRMDRGVLEACGLSYGDQAPWNQLAGKGRKKIFETKEFEQICGSCQWHELCRRTEVSYE
ncbi:MAG TPA: DUF1284 domain-containing protein [Candidatus Enterocloster faecavium]|uniref:DUF1284 domain-containing protein n=1 Tax=Candidatus Enterocloster faecavium TaxID=2838560 RepID=A0A9D2RMK0_9FIRM|nr:DUF1284 domain-containing protein [Candidatus Enterocloster faecavium]